MSTTVVACGALAVHIQAIARTRGWDVEVRPLPALLHNHPERIAPAVREALTDDVVALAYADCGTYGALDEIGVPRLQGDHCYDVLARDEVRAALDEEPGTYFLTDFLARTFERTVWRELGSTAIPSCATPTSATTRACSGSPNTRRPPRAPPPSAPRPGSSCRSRSARSATRASKSSWPM